MNKWKTISLPRPRWYRLLQFPPRCWTQSRFALDPWMMSSPTSPLFTLSQIEYQIHQVRQIDGSKRNAKQKHIYQAKNTTVARWSGQQSPAFKHKLLPSPDYGPVCGTVLVRPVLVAIASGSLLSQRFLLVQAGRRRWGWFCDTGYSLFGTRVPHFPLLLDKGKPRFRSKVRVSILFHHWYPFFHHGHLFSSSWVPLNPQGCPLYGSQVLLFCHRVLHFPRPGYPSFAPRVSSLTPRGGHVLIKNTITQLRIW